MLLVVPNCLNQLLVGVPPALAVVSDAARLFIDDGAAVTRRQGRPITGEVQFDRLAFEQVLDHTAAASFFRTQLGDLLALLFQPQQRVSCGGGPTCELSLRGLELRT